MKADLIFTVDLLPREIRALQLAASGLEDYLIGNEMSLSKGAVEMIFRQLWLHVNLGTAAHDGQLTVKPLTEQVARKTA